MCERLTREREEEEEGVAEVEEASAWVEGEEEGVGGVPADVTAGQEWRSVLSCGSVEERERGLGVGEDSDAEVAS